jgi:hypothetical protein
MSSVTAGKDIVGGLVKAFKSLKQKAQSQGQQDQEQRQQQQHDINCSATYQEQQQQRIQQQTDDTSAANLSPEERKKKRQQRKAAQHQQNSNNTASMSSETEVPLNKAVRGIILNQIWDSYRSPTKQEYAMVKGTDGLKYFLIVNQAPCKGQPAWSTEKRLDFLQRINFHFSQLINHIDDFVARATVAAWVQRSKAEGFSSVNEHVNYGGVEGYTTNTEANHFAHGRMFVKIQQLGPCNQLLPDDSLYALTFNLALHEMVHIIWGLHDHGVVFDQRMEQLRFYAKRLHVPGF